MPLYNLIKHNNNYSDTSGSLRQFKKDKLPASNDGNPENIAADNSASFKYVSSIIGKADTDDANGKAATAKVVAKLKYISNFWQSLEMPLDNCKIDLALNWIKICVMSTVAGDTTFKITKLYVSIVALSTKGNVTLSKEFSEGF